MNGREKEQIQELKRQLEQDREDLKVRYDIIDKANKDVMWKLAEISEHLKMQNATISKCVTDIALVQKQMSLYETLPKVFKWSLCIVVALVGLGGAVWGVEHLKMAYQFIFGK